MAAQSSGGDFRATLVKLSNILKPEELTAMKYMCKDFIGRRDMEKITSFFQLCDTLESHDKLAADNVVFLENLLKSCCGGRQDVLHVLESYSKPQNGMRHGQVPNMTYIPGPGNVAPQVVYVAQTPAQSYTGQVPVAPVTGQGYPAHTVIPSNVTYSAPNFSYKHIEREINYLTRKLGREWRFFMRTLGVTDYDMAEMEQKYPRSMRDQIHGCFMVWIQNRQGKVSADMILKALKDVSVERFDLAANIEDQDFT